METPTQRYTSQDAIAVVMATEGNLDLAAERLFGPAPVVGSGGTHPKTKLIALLTQDVSTQAELQRVLRTLSMLQAFSTLKLVGATIDGALETMGADTRAKLYLRLMQLMSELTDDHTQTINSNSRSMSVSISEQVLRALPAEVRDAVKALIQPSTLALEEANEIVNGTRPPYSADNDPAEYDVNGWKPPQHWSLGDPPPNAARP